MSSEQFYEQVEDNMFWNVPAEYFDVTSYGVFLDARIASKIDWQIDEQIGDITNINARSQQIELDGETLNIETGFWCSNVPTNAIKEQDSVNSVDSFLSRLV